MKFKYNCKVLVMVKLVDEIWLLYCKYMLCIWLVFYMDKLVKINILMYEKM